MSPAADVVFELRGTAAAGAFAGGHWTFRRGEQWAVTGPNGSGKSYLAALLTGEAPLRGLQLSFAEDVEDRAALASFSQQQDQASGGWLQARWHSMDDADALSVQTFLSYERINDINPFEVRGDEAAERRAFSRSLRKASDIFRLAPLMERRMVQLSNGEMRRVLLAGALLKSPRLLVLDDPFAGLDPDMRTRLQGALNRLADEGLSLVLMVRHADEIPACVTHVLALKNLRIAGHRKWSPPSAPTAADKAVVDAAVKTPMHASNAEPVVELHDVTVRYGRRTVLNRFAWTVRSGERWLVVGPNGSGKTTLLSLITGDNPSAYANDVRVFGRARVPGESLWPLRRRMGQVSPELQCYFDAEMTGLNAVLSGRFNAEGRVMRPTAAVRSEAHALLKELGVADAANASFGSLSAGRQRLVLLARALLPHPDLLLLDEPCLNLDTESRRLVLKTIERLLRVRRDETVICVAHRADDVPRGFQRVLRLGAQSARE